MTKLATANNPIYAVRCLIRACKLLTHPQLRKYLWIPISINLVLYGIAFTLGYFYLSELIAQLIPRWLSWLEWLIWPLFFIAFSVLGFFTFTLLANTLAAPFYSQLAAATWALAGGQQHAITQQPISRVLSAELRRVGYLVSRMLPLLILFLIPLLNLIAPILWALFGAWGVGLEFMAYPLENQGVLFEQQKQQLSSRKWGVLSLGGLVLLGMSIPILNLIMPPLAVIGATLYHQGISEQG